MDYITNPFQKEEVLISLRTHLERAKLAEELGLMNIRLEQMVEERTEQLQQKVKELEGKDRIAQHLLTYHTLDETLALILEVILEVTGVVRAVVHLKEEDVFKAKAGIGISDAGGIATPEQLDQLDLSALQEAFATVQERREPVQVDGQVGVLVPILRGDDFLGLIEVDNGTAALPVGSQTLETVESFSLQAAVAISDAQVQMDAGRWKDQLEDVFKLDEVITEVDQLDDLAGGSKG
ncbi:MAG: GAF domain-containing protein [bacterium]|nr:GAF domain-containing protein [bacterium]